jgi:hypothetical protein
VFSDTGFSRLGRIVGWFFRIVCVKDEFGEIVGCTWIVEDVFPGFDGTKHGVRVGVVRGK